jgi:hypothetical protein
MPKPLLLVNPRSAAGATGRNFERAMDILGQRHNRNGFDLALELLPRITRAQSMDVLSSMATVEMSMAVTVTPRSSMPHISDFSPQPSSSTWAGGWIGASSSR